MIDLPISNTLIYLSTLFLFIAAVVIPTFVIPLQVKQAYVKNGLSLLRKQLLIVGVVLFATDMIALYYVGRAAYRIYTLNLLATYTNGMVLFSFSTGYLILSILFYQIYRQQYTQPH